MSRGGRRRRRRGRRPARPEGQEGLGQSLDPDQSANKLPRRRRKGARRSAAGKSVLESMSSRPTTLTTLPPDGLVLEELIEDLQDEYGTPATPQEYRLIIKVATRDEAKDVLVETEPPDIEEPLDPGEAQQPAIRVETRKRQRRRRGRRRGTGPDGSPGTDRRPAGGNSTGP